VEPANDHLSHPGTENRPKKELNILGTQAIRKVRKEY
jgi:hypothetical protein